MEVAELKMCDFIELKFILWSPHRIRGLVNESVKYVQTSSEDSEVYVENRIEKSCNLQERKWKIKLFKLTTTFV